jgi:adenosylcobinamide kinase/adenosylcobinamide-phosphate guanylyltransferase
MQLVVGGAYAGKRKIVRQKVDRISWVSSYTGDSLENWKSEWSDDTSLVLEGWERWLAEDLKQGMLLDQVREKYSSMLLTIRAEEHRRKSNVLFIMLEMGRGIVPMNEEERKLRDVSGWLLQDASEHAEEVTYVWHGLSQTLKGDTNT